MFPAAVSTCRSCQRSVLLSTVLTGALLLVLAAPAPAAPRCDGRAAAELEQRLPVTPYNVGRRIGQTKCFDFTGDGRKDIVFTGWEYMNHGAHYWAAFRATANNWLRVKFKRSCCRENPAKGAGILIKRSGTNIVVRQPIYRSSDAACCPSGGTRTGTWRWHRSMLELLQVTRDP